MMGRTVRSRRQPYVRPVEKVEISEKHIGRRAIAAAVFLLIGAGALAYFFVNLVRGDSGWTEIKAASSQLSYGGDFTFLYETGAGGSSAMQEKRAVTAAYTAAVQKAYWMFENVESESAAGGSVGAGSEENVLHGIAAAESDGDDVVCVGSVRYINTHPNEIVTVDAPLYEAFAKLEAAGVRNLYLPAVYEVYNNLFSSESDLIAAEFDPRTNSDVAAYFKEVLAYANDPAEVNLKLLGDGQVRLHVSEEYLAFAAENEIDSFIDFYWMKNAFIADYLAEELTAAGFTHGSLSSYDGFVRNLDGREIEYSLNIYDRVAQQETTAAAKGGAAQTAGTAAKGGAAQTAGTAAKGGAAQTAGTAAKGGAAQTVGTAAKGSAAQLATLKYRGPASLIWLHDFAAGLPDQQHDYQMSDGCMRTVYIDPRDGLCRSSISSLISYSYDDNMGCADILLSLMPIYIADEFDAEALEALAGNAADPTEASTGDDKAGGSSPIYSIYRQGDVIHTNDQSGRLDGIYEGYTARIP